MCNISGYIGREAAAPMLIEMMRRQSGFGGGYYTGIATIHEGKIYCAKVLGDVDRLCAETNALELPGVIGIMHSRSNSGGDGAWSHPFLSCDERLAYVANGSSGAYAKMRDADAVSAQLAEEGIRFRSAAKGMETGYPKLRDGSSVHISETMCHLIRKIMLSENCAVSEAMERAFLRFPSEIVGLCVSTEEPDRISFARFNQPMMVGRTREEVFLGTSAMAFPEDRAFLSVTQLPEASAGFVTRRETLLRRFRPAIPITPLDPKVMRDAWEAVLRGMTEVEKPLSLGEICGFVKPVFPADAMPQAAPAAYEVLRDMKRRGMLEFYANLEPGAPEGAEAGITTTQFRMELKKKR